MYGLEKENSERMYGLLSGVGDASCVQKDSACKLKGERNP
jgi:hypothetical protein